MCGAHVTEDDGVVVREHFIEIIVIDYPTVNFYVELIVLGRWFVGVPHAQTERVRLVREDKVSPAGNEITSPTAPDDLDPVLGLDVSEVDVDEILGLQDLEPNITFQHGQMKGLLLTALVPFGRGVNEFGVDRLVVFRKTVFNTFIIPRPVGHLNGVIRAGDGVENYPIDEGLPVFSSVESPLVHLSPNLSVPDLPMGQCIPCIQRIHHVFTSIPDGVCPLSDMILMRIFEYSDRRRR